MASFKTSFFDLIKFGGAYSFLNIKFEREELKVIYQYPKLRIDSSVNVSYIVAKITSQN